MPFQPPSGNPASRSRAGRFNRARRLAKCESRVRKVEAPRKDLSRRCFCLVLFCDFFFVVALRTFGAGQLHQSGAFEVFPIRLKVAVPIDFTTCDIEALLNCAYNGEAAAQLRAGQVFCGTGGPVLPVRTQQEIATADKGYGNCIGRPEMTRGIFALRMVWRLDVVGAFA